MCGHSQLKRDLPTVHAVCQLICLEPQFNSPQFILSLSCFFFVFAVGFELKNALEFLLFRCNSFVFFFSSNSFVLFLNESCLFVYIHLYSSNGMLFELNQETQYKKFIVSNNKYFGKIANVFLRVISTFFNLRFSSSARKYFKLRIEMVSQFRQIKLVFKIFWHFYKLIYIHMKHFCSNKDKLNYCKYFFYFAL